MPNTYVNGDRVAELWLEIQSALGQKADQAQLSGYATPDAVAQAIVSALTNYATNATVQSAITTALKNYMTASETSDAIAAAVAESAHVTFTSVDRLPPTGQANTIYLVPGGEAEAGNLREEYMWLNGAWEQLGTTQTDLSGYWSKEELHPMTAEELQEILV